MKLKTFFAWPAVNVFIVLVLTLGMASCATVHKQTKPGDELNTLQDISVTEQPDKTEIVVAGQKALVYTSYQLTDPARLIVDLAGASVGKFKDRIPIGQGAVTDLVPIEGEKPSNVVRLEITLTEPVLSHVRADGEKLLIDIDKPTASAATETAAPSTSEAASNPSAPEAQAMTEAAQQTPVPPPPVVEEKPAPSEPALPAAKTVSKLTVDRDKDTVAIHIAGDGALKPNAFMVEGNRLVVDLPDVTNAIRPNTISVKHSLLKSIRIGQHLKPMKVRVVFDLNSKASFTVEPSGKEVVVALSAAAGESSPGPAEAKAKPNEEQGEKPPVTEATPAQPQEKPQEAGQVPPDQAPRETTHEEMPKEKTVVREKPKPAPLPEAMTSAAAVEPMKKGEITARKRYVGRKISLDFQDADLSNVLRLLADVSGLNIVISEGVKGKVTLKLISVPWDQALDIVLKMNSLGQTRDGNIIRVATLADIAKQQDEEAHAKDAKFKAEDLITKVIFVNYASAQEMALSLKKTLSPRGDVTVDLRTNTIVVKDIDKEVNEAVALAKALDTRTPQVQIEARIVQADTSFAQSLGIQWGLGFSAIKSNSAFGVQGINSGAGITPPAFGTFAPDFAVNLPGSVSGLNAVPAVGFNFGRFTENPINLDLRLSAGELNGLTKTISSPKVTTMDNFQAKIEQGESIPFQTSSANTGPTTTFVDANLTLEVTPHITPDHSIILKVKAARDSIGSFSGPAGPSIAKREATTEVLLNDGETTVIGGIFVDERSETESGVPFLSRIPVLGWLFKNETKTDTKNELLIFLTPRIVKQ
ncbi:MAG TPA: type IV pilus secretin PilQ [Nitrospiria bacterium]|nr:type IV pilus secretin PilQ [Nitrospiria bacterium]